MTDITYIPISGSMLYMCAVLDLCGKAVLAWKSGSAIWLRDLGMYHPRQGGLRETVLQGVLAGDMSKSDEIPLELQCWS